MMSEDKEMQSVEIDKAKEVSFIAIDTLDVKTLQAFKELFSKDIEKIQKSFEQYSKDVDALMDLYKFWSQARTEVDEKVTLLDTSLKKMKDQVERFKLFDEKMISWRKRLQWSLYRIVGVFCLASMLGGLGGGFVVDHFWSTHEPIQPSKTIQEINKKIKEVETLKASYRDALINQYKLYEFAALPKNVYQCTLLDWAGGSKTQEGNVCTFAGWIKGMFKG